MTAGNSFSICAPGLSTLSYLSRIVAQPPRRAASTVISLLPKATFTPSIQPNLGLPRTRPPLTSAINNFEAVYGSTHTFFSHAQTISILSDPLYSQLPFYSSSPTHIFIPTWKHQTWTLQPNFSNTSSQEHSLSFSQHFSYPMPLFRTTPLVQLLFNIDTS